MSDPVVDTQFVSGTVITSAWLNGVNDFVNTDGATKAELANQIDVTKGATLIGFDGNTVADQFKNRVNRVVTTITALRALDKTKYTRAFVTGYYAASDGGGGAYQLDAADVVSVDNGGTIIVATDGGRWKLQTNGPVSVKQFGAKGDGVNDDAPLIQACIMAVSDTYIPAGEYLLNSTNPAPIPVTNPINILISEKSFFRVVMAKGARLRCSNTANFSCQVGLYKCNNFTLRGFTHEGNRTGITATQETVALMMGSVTNFLVEDMHVSGDWKDSGAMFGGDWWVNGTIRKVVGDSVGIGFDIAFMQNCVFDDVTATGSSNAPGGNGNIGFSSVYDVPLENENATGIVFDGNITNHIYCSSMRMRHFNTGMFLNTGNYYYFDSNCEFSGNEGTAAVASGWGVVLNYTNGGDFTSVDNPVHHVFFNGSQFVANAGLNTGAGVLIDSSAISNSDTIHHIYFRGCNFESNNATGLLTPDVTNLSNIVIDGNEFIAGGAQTTAISADLLNIANSATLPNNVRITQNYGVNPVGFVGQALPAGVGAGNIVVNTHAYPVDVNIFTQTFVYDPVIRNPAGADTNLGNVAANSAPINFRLDPGYGVYFITAVPASWAWYGL